MSDAALAPALTLSELHAMHARALASAAACRRDYAMGGTRWHARDLALRTAKTKIDAARNFRVVIEQRRG